MGLTLESKVLKSGHSVFSLMNEDTSWSLGEDYEQDYAELTSFVIRFETTPCQKMLEIKPQKFKGVSVYFDPNFVQDILCPGPQGGDLTTIIDDDELRCQFVAKNEAYVVGIEYPEPPPLIKAKHDKFGLFSSRIANERLQTLDHVRHDDSLVTKSLLDMTSYPAKNDREDENNNNKISFEDLGKIYKNISRSQILSNVQCSNVHFHAHPDGSTTIHKHKACPTPSINTLDPRRKLSNDSKGKVTFFAILATEFTQPPLRDKK